ncbi:hypothetical protein [uncultured Adlercreutzia sp.]|uniref:hypothetical protein n=1 Tax=uncultured Adlercreutzia sp. TaxID=875803 RepID=UPI0026767FE6|nr:hypothetical protein [uncultured Adlercreutzia sp.]
MKLSDKLLYALFILAAAALASLSFCAADWAWGVITIAVVLAWAWMLHSRCTRGRQKGEDSPGR